MPSPRCKVFADLLLHHGVCCGGHKCSVLQLNSQSVVEGSTTWQTEHSGCDSNTTMLHCACGKRTGRTERRLLRNGQPLNRCCELSKVSFPFGATRVRLGGAARVVEAPFHGAAFLGREHEGYICMGIDTDAAWWKWTRRRPRRDHAGAGQLEGFHHPDHWGCSSRLVSDPPQVFAS